MPILRLDGLPASAPAPIRRRLVDYSDSESDDDDIDPPPATASGATTTTDAEPETENELAGIVIELQKKYIREVEDIGEKQAQWKREVQSWKATFEEKWKLEQKLLRGLIKNVYGINVEELLAKEGLSSGPAPNIETQGPPSPFPSPSPPALPAAFPNGSRSLTPAPQQYEDLMARESEIQAGGTPKVAAVLPQRARSTGKKAPRPNVAANRRPYQPKRKPVVAKPKPTEITNDSGINLDADGMSSQPSEKQSDVRPQQLAPHAEPPSPYDDPKYFSSLTVTGADGVERPIFKFYKHPDMVEEQWAEWKYGLHDQPPVEQLEDKYRARWRREAYSRSWFTRRKAFWDRMKQMMMDGKTEEEALDVMRSLAQAKGSVPGLVAALVAERGGKGGNVGMKRKRSPNLVGKRSRESSKSITDEETDSDKVSDRAVRICPTMRKRVMLIDIEPVHNSDADTPSGADDDDDEWTG
ncbi:hypothetical protein CkaCkLH20_09197 [Colletotrichum karsti]|uniref:Transcription activator GCR1-like domain-containing protein n=1 Tax=Colletotrichum karsti TaxID=1095194 RepID=A0A9P6HZM7_9PEZI|nr:uncharacterized protein CkaCkLH20_09197 [Colletotrichum karsti]KAF9873384.1 hypothetical protein CkaCkLH20_09197 [Colletotrichum karsti]